jgi:hypothetical protein
VEKNNQAKLKEIGTKRGKRFFKSSILSCLMIGGKKGRENSTPM